ncbi:MULTISPECIES: hypothetical protein [Novosphingobium]|uniref:Lipoprotein n=1 Tax=Novosphingobium mangrovi (ex Hu et al. 2023) TaxID=2930094 RepID=A0ABT0AGV1_9SPHN|nr:MULTISPECIES: hypothetical protein [Novosphingobium]MCJ1962390.1 hypothetical protein [Novosphingobium mangrovi (ex Hu et al. 2023)]
MSATLIALALFGCSDDGTACRRLEAQAPVATFQTRAECDRQLEDALETDAALRADAPTVYAQCLPSAQLAALGTGEVDLTRVGKVQFAQN